jgi:hypothetical protein
MKLIHNIKNSVLTFLKGNEGFEVLYKKEANNIDQMNKDSETLIKMIQTFENENKDNTGYDASLVLANLVNEMTKSEQNNSFKFNKLFSYLITNKVAAHLEDLKYLMLKLEENNFINTTSKTEMYDQSQSANHFYSLIKNGDEKALYVNSTIKFIVFIKKEKIYIRKVSINDIEKIILNGFVDSFFDLYSFDSNFILESDLFNELSLPKSRIQSMSLLELALFNIHSGACSIETEFKGE